MSISKEDIEHILRLDGNADDARMMIATEFSKGKNNEAIADFLKSTFHGGNGIVTNNGRYSVWYAEDGIHIANGDSARYLHSAKIVPWVEAAERIRTLLESGNYATNVELTEMRGYEVKTAAEHLWYMHQDMADSIRDRYFDDAMWKGGFPDSTARIRSMLADDSMCEVIVNETARFAEAYAQDKSLMRFRLYLPERILHELTELGIPRHEYRSDMAKIPAVKHFITEDEIAAFLTRRSMEYSKSRIYGYFFEKHAVQEQAKFLKDDYGTGGGSHAVSRASHSGKNYSGKGLVLEK